MRRLHGNDVAAGRKAGLAVVFHSLRNETALKPKRRIGRCVAALRNSCKGDGKYLLELNFANKRGRRDQMLLEALTSFAHSTDSISNLFIHKLSLLSLSTALTTLRA